MTDTEFSQYNSALFGTVTVDGVKHKIIVPGRDIGAGCAKSGPAEFFRAFIRQKVNAA